MSFPAIATGAYGYPKDRAAAVASQAIAEALGQRHSVRRVHLVFFSDADRRTFERTSASPKVHGEFISRLEQCHEPRDLVSFRGWKVPPTL
jgi:hypothetical protein